MTRIEPGPDDRYLILAPHPDDETLSAGGLIQGVLKAGGRVKIVYLTNGEHNLISAVLYHRKFFLKKTEVARFGELRQREAIDAARVLGLAENDLHFLGYPDLWILPMRSALGGKSIVSDLKGVLCEYRPTHVVVPSAQDGHADHRATSIYLEEALRATVPPEGGIRLLDYQVHKGFKFWGRQVVNAFYSPSTLERESKRRAIFCYPSQTAYRRGFLLSFEGPSESFLAHEVYGQKDLISQAIVCTINQY